MIMALARRGCFPLAPDITVHAVVSWTITSQLFQALDAYYEFAASSCSDSPNARKHTAMWLKFVKLYPLAGWVRRRMSHVASLGHLDQI